MICTMLLAMLDIIIPDPVIITPTNVTVRAEYRFNTGPVIKPEKFVTILLMFITKATPTVPWPIASNSSPKISPNRERSDWLTILLLKHKSNSVTIQWLSILLLTFVTATPSTTIQPHPPSGTSLLTFMLATLKNERCVRVERHHNAICHTKQTDLAVFLSTDTLY